MKVPSPVASFSLSRRQFLTGFALVISGVSPYVRLFAQEQPNYSEIASKFVNDRIDLFVKKHSNFNSKQEFADTITNFSNESLIEAIKQFPVLENKQVKKSYNAQIQSEIVKILIQKVKSIFKESTNSELFDCGYVESTNLSKAIFFDEKQSKVCSLDILKSYYKQDPKAFVALDNKTYSVDFSNPLFDKFRNFLGLLTNRPNLVLKEELISVLNSPWPQYSGTCIKDQIVVNDYFIDIKDKVTNFDFRGIVFVNEKLHQELFKAYSSLKEPVDAFRSEAKLVSEPILGIKLENNHQVEEILSDLSSALVIPDAFAEMIGDSYPFSKTMAIAILEKLGVQNLHAGISQAEVEATVKQQLNTTINDLAKGEKFFDICMSLAKDIGARYKKHYAK